MKFSLMFTFFYTSYSAGNFFFFFRLFISLKSMANGFDEAGVITEENVTLLLLRIRAKKIKMFYWDHRMKRWI